jgi:subtilase family serine protease
MNCLSQARQRLKKAAAYSHTSALILFIFIILSGTTTSLFAQPAPNFCDWQGPWASTAPLAQAREGATATRLNDGRVLVVGGIGAAGSIAQAEIYDATGTQVTASASMSVGRVGHIAVLLNDGRVLIAGGDQTTGGWSIPNRQASAEVFDPATNQFSPVGSMTGPRLNATAVLLADGRVLVTGGWGRNIYPIEGIVATAEIFNPATNSFSATGSMSLGRNWHTATRLADGRVIVTGGDAMAGPTNTTEIYNPATGAFTVGPSMSAARRYHTATLVRGMLIVAGGENESGVLASTESYSGGSFFSNYVPLSGPRKRHTATLLPGGKLMLAGGANANGDLNSVEITPNGAYGFEVFAFPMPSARSAHAAALLGNGGVLFVGNRAGASQLASAVVYDPKFGAVGPMNSTRTNQTATKLLTGEVLIAGGQTNTEGLPATASADLYSPVSRTFSALPPMSSPRHQHTATLLNDGRVLIVGGQTSFMGGQLATAEIYNPATHSFSSAGSMSTARTNHTATLLPNGRVLITGGIVSGATGLATAELYDPATNTFVPTGAMSRDRFNHSATLLPNGRVLIAGGRSAGAITYSAELYDPTAGAFTPAQSMVVNRMSHTATLMWNGQVLIAGGATGNNNPTRSAEVYDPASGYFWQVGDMALQRHFHAAVQSDLPGGKVLILGGSTQSSTGSTDAVEQYDPSTGVFAPVTGKLQFDRYRHTATLLDDTSILITGGSSNYSAWGASAELSKPTHCGPLVTSMSPNAGQWGTPVVIGGSQFGSDPGLSTVAFNGVIAPITSWSDTQIVTSVPHGATTGPVVITVNGRQSNSPSFSVGAPDLSIDSISANPASAAPNAPVTITVTVRNSGTAAVDAFRLDFYKHSATPPPGWGDFACDLPGMAAGATVTCVGTVTYAAQGTQSMWAVVDVPGAIDESNESNNVFGPQSLVVAQPMPDLVESAMANPPATALLGGSISLSDTVRNNGNAQAVASNTRYYLSLDAVKSANDTIMLVRSVPVLAAGATHTYNPTITLSSTLALNSYYVLVCADDANQVSESDETNNCRASSTQVQVVSPDMVVTAVSNPPASVGVGGSFVMSDTVLNQGNGSAGVSATRYWLSADQVKGAGDRLLNGVRSVPALAVNASSSGAATVSVASGTALGTYFVVACADDQSQVVEANNNNNCASSASQIVVTGSDLINASGSNPPASATPGTSFVFSHDVMNQGAVAANATSVSRFYLGLKPVHDPADTLLTGTRSVAALAPGAHDVATVTVAIPRSIAEGSYYLFACADDLRTVTETNESNNCWRSASTVAVSGIVIGIPK